MPSQHLLQPVPSLEAKELGGPRELVTQEIRCSGPADYGDSTTGQTPLIYAIPCSLSYCYPPSSSPGIREQPAGPGFYVFIRNSGVHM